MRTWSSRCLPTWPGVWPSSPTPAEVGTPPPGACVRLDGATGPTVGARFDATNEAGRGKQWKNRPIVTVADPGREFAVARTEMLAGTVVWRYRFEPEEGGTRITESYEVTRPITRMGWFVIERIYGCGDRRAELRAGMHQTLERIRAVAEQASSSAAVDGPVRYPGDEPNATDGS